MDDKHLQKLSFNLQKAFLKLHKPKEVFNFIRDLLTEDEIIEFSQRFDIASRLHKWQNYKKIEEETWSSSTTIARVAKFLKWKIWGYKNVLDN